MKNFKLGIIGCGNMSQAIIKGIFSESGQKLFKENGLIPQISVSDISLETLEKVKRYNVNTTCDNKELVENSEYILFAVKPQMFNDVIKELDFSNRIILSIMAGVRLDNLLKLSNKAVRIMPNLNARISQAVNSYALANLTKDEENIVTTILNTFGKSYRINEDKMNTITGVCGSGPAFVFMFIDSFIDKLVTNGLDANIAREMAISTIVGSANLINFEKDTSIEKLVDSVCSKGGTTIEGVNFLRENDFKNIVETALERAIIRAGELDKR